MNIEQLLRAGPVIPVIVIEELAHAVPLARALVAGGLTVLEVTLRTPASLASIRAIAQEVEGVRVGAGTLTQPQDFDRALEAGALFGVSPGFTPQMLEAARNSGLAFLPGAMTPGDVLAAKAAGLTALKFFPATAAGGVAMLRALAGPFPEVLFCPTGGITAASAPEFLALPNVACVGGTWLTPAASVATGDWAHITELARSASALRGSGSLTTSNMR